MFLFMSSAAMGIIFIYSIFLAPPNAINIPEAPFFLDVHFIAYFGFSLLVYETFRISPWDLSRTRRCLLTFTWVFVYSFSLELLQFLAPIRQFEVADISVSFLGACSGAILMVTLRDYSRFNKT